MLMPTPAQRAKLTVHYAWDLLEEGMSEPEAIQAMIDEAAPEEFAREAVKCALEGQTKVVHTSEQRAEYVARLGEAIGERDFDAIREVLMDGIDDERTLHKLYSKLADELVSDSHMQGTAAAYGLSFLFDRGDWPMIQALSHKDEMVRYRAAFGLGKMGKYAKNAIPALQQCLKDSDDLVRDAAATALAAIQKPWWKFW